MPETRDNDPQANLVYGAEAMMRKIDKYAQRLSLREIEEFLDHIVSTRWFRNRNGGLLESYVVHDGRGGSMARVWWNDDYTVCYLAFPRGLRDKLMVLHELAHGLVGGGHGGEFCSTYLKLVRRFMGQEAWSSLKFHFRCLEIKCRCPPRPHCDFDEETGEFLD